MNMDVNNNLNLLTAVTQANNPQTQQNAQEVAAAAQSTQANQLLGGQSVPQDILDLSGSRPRSEVNMNDIHSSLAQSQRQTEAFRRMIQQLLNRQADTATMVDGQMMITIDEETRARAQREIAEDGYFGVEQTSERILAFARAFAGDDIGRMEIMRDAFLAGFEAAERAWGGELPEISQQTRAAVLRGFDEMMGITPAADAE